MNAILIVLPILTLLMFDLGLICDLKSFFLVAQNPRSLLVGLGGQIILLPVIAAVLGIIFHLEPVFFIGLMLIACSPGGSSSNIFSMLAKGNVALSITLTGLSSIITLFTIPIIMTLVMQYIDKSTHLVIHLPVGKLIVQNILLTFLPFCLGVFYAFKFKKSSIKMSRILGKVAFPSLMLLASLFFIQNWHIIITNFNRIGLCIICYIAATMIGTSILCKKNKLSKTDHKTIVIEVVMQNAAQAIAIASSPFIYNNNIIAIPAILYALFMNIVLLGYIQTAKMKSIPI